MTAIALLPARLVGYVLRLMFETAIKVLVTGAIILGAVFAGAWWLNG